MKFFNRLSNILQDKKDRGRNLAAFKALIEVGFSPAEARRMLLAGNAIRVKHLAKTAEVTAPTIYAACYGKRNNSLGKEAIAKALDIPIPDLFPEMQNG